MGVIDLDARVKKLEEGGAGGAVIDQLESAVTALEETVNGNGTTDLGLVGDVSDLETAVSAIETASVADRHTIELESGFTEQTANGGCFYETIGNIVHIHIAVDGFTSGTAATLSTLPEAVRPDIPIYFRGNTAGYVETSKVASGKVLADGKIDIFPYNGTSCNADFVYFIPAPTPGE